jgi:hypothetical protein
VVKYEIEIPDELVERIVAAKAVKAKIWSTDPDFWTKWATASRQLEQLYRELSEILPIACPLYDLAVDQLVEHRFTAERAEREAGEQA